MPYGIQGAETVDQVVEKLLLETLGRGKGHRGAVFIFFLKVCKIFGNIFKGLFPGDFFPPAFAAFAGGLNVLVGLEGAHVVVEPIRGDARLLGNIAACRDLIQAIREDRPPECDVYQGRCTVEMINAVFDSHRTRGPVKFPLKTRENALGLL